MAPQLVPAFLVPCYLSCLEMAPQKEKDAVDHLHTQVHDHGTHTVSRCGGLQVWTRCTAEQVLSHQAAQGPGRKQLRSVDLSDRGACEILSVAPLVAPAPVQKPLCVDTSADFGTKISAALCASSGKTNVCTAKWCLATSNLRLHHRVVLGRAGTCACVPAACAHAKQKEAITTFQHLSASLSHVIILLDIHTHTLQPYEGLGFGTLEYHTVSDIIFSVLAWGAQGGQAEVVGRHPQSHAPLNTVRHLGTGGTWAPHITPARRDRTDCHLA